MGGVGDIFDLSLVVVDVSTGPQRGADREMQVTIDFEDAAFGAERTFSFLSGRLQRSVMVVVLNQALSVQTCPTCRGKGQVRSVQSTPLGRFETVRTCNRCGGVR